MGGSPEERRRLMAGTVDREVLTSFGRGAVLALGWIFLFLGAVGLFIPIVPGSLLLLAGGSILRRQSHPLLWASKCREHLRMRIFDAALGSNVSQRFKERSERSHSIVLSANKRFGAAHLTGLRANHGTTKQRRKSERS